MYSPTEVCLQDVRVGIEMHVVDDSFSAIHSCQYQVTAGLPCWSFCSSLRLVSLQLCQRLSNLPQL